MKKFLLLSFMLMFAFTFSESWAQERTVSGKVTAAETGEALPGVNVVLKGTTTGTVTDIDGNYKLSVPSDGGTLVFSFIGLATEEVQIGNRSVIDVQLSSDIQQLSEVVVVGYGEVDKRKLTSAITSVDAEELAKMPVPSFDVALQGKAPGVQVSTTSGLLGEAPKIRIRGVNSISSGTSPLVVLDGVPIETGDLSFGIAPNNALADLNPNDIASYEVLKDGAATAIYGSRATNGVILITTKQGKAGQTKVNYDFYVGATEAANRFELLNANEFIQISNEKFATGGNTPQAFPGPNNVDTDWQDVIFRTGTVQSHNLSFSGGSESTKFFASAGYMTQEGHVVNNSIERYSMRLNLDYTGVKWLDAGIKVQLTQQRNEGLNTGTNALSGNVSNATSAFPNISPFDPNDPTGFNLTPDRVTMGQGNNLQRIAFNLPNIAWVLANNQQESQTTRIISNSYLQANLPFDIKIRSQIGANLSDTRDFLSRNPLHGDGRPTGFVFRGYSNITTWNWQNTISWKRTFDEVHSVALVAGSELQKRRFDSFTGSGQEFSDDFFISEGLISDTYNTQFSSGFVGEESFESWFGRLNYDYDGKYLFSASIRRDGISKLPEENRFGTFLGGSVGWMISNEGFFNVPVINELKLRGGFAETGNDNLPGGLFPTVGTYGPELYGPNTAIRFENVGNPSLVWETTTKTNIGIDFSLFPNGRLSGSIDWYKNAVIDLVLNRPTAMSLGIPGNDITTNVGEIENSGIEIALNSINITNNDFEWSTNFNLTTNENEITKLANNNADVILTYNVLRVGESIGALWGFESAGVNPANGNPLYVKGDGTVIQGNPDNNTYYVYNPEDPTDLSTTSTLSDADDKKVIGQTVPDFFGGITNNFRYKNFDLSIAMTYSIGQQVYNATLQEGLTQNFSNNPRLILDRWTPTNTNTTVPRLSLRNDNFLNQDGNATTRFVEDGDFLRVQNITLGYRLPQSVLNNIALSTVRIYAQVQNAFVFTGYTGLDPELSFSNTTNQQAGIDLNSNPLPRTYTVGVNIGF